MSTAKSKTPTGLRARHSKLCASKSAAACNCTPSWEAWVWSVADDRKVRKTFKTKAAAKQWRRDAAAAVAQGTLSTPSASGPLVGERLDALIAGMKDGSILDRSGRQYRPVTIRGYESDIRTAIRRRLGHLRLDEVKRGDVQRLVDRLHADGLSGSTIRNKLDPLRVILRRAVQDEEIPANPAQTLRLPAIARKPRRIADPGRAAVLLDALPDSQRALWATAFYAGLRMGELRALRWRHIDFAAGVLNVEAGWDDVEGEQAPKTAAGVRTVPLVGRLRAELARHKLATGRDGDDLVFGETATRAPVRSTVRSRALRAWGWTQVTDPTAKPQTTWVKASDDAMDPLTPHECRHTCASYLAAAGVPVKDVQAAMGHAHVATTLDLYAKSVPGWERAATDRLDAWLNQQAAGAS